MKQSAPKLQALIYLTLSLPIYNISGISPHLRRGIGNSQLKKALCVRNKSEKDDDASPGIGRAEPCFYSS